MIGLDLLRILEDSIYKLPYPVLMGLVGASFLASIPWLFTALLNWISDLGRYGPIFPFFWAASALILLLSRTVENVNVSEDCKGWMEYLILFGVTTFMALILYLTFFLVFCFLEVVSHHFKWFFYTWLLTFLLITIALSLWIYFGNGSSFSWFTSQKTSSCSDAETPVETAGGGSWFGGSSAPSSAPNSATGGGGIVGTVQKCPKTPAKY